MQSYTQLVDFLCDSTESEHCYGCDDYTCDIMASMRAGYGVWAAECFANSGAASEAFEAAYAQVQARFAQRWAADAENERREFADSVVFAACNACNAQTMVPHEEICFFDEPFACPSCHEPMPAIVE